MNNDCEILHVLHVRVSNLSVLFFLASIFAWTRGLLHRAKLDGKLGTLCGVTVL